ncbi:MAG: S8 family serine peptidase, partial [Candidatus Thermoplasmatota archaeon]|nr:S8 family serine peptidase [Candidatus Thermoplasmatota archaeon]
MSKQIVLGMLTILLLSIFATIPSPQSESNTISDEEQYAGYERIPFDMDAAHVGDAYPSEAIQGEERIRSTSADTHLGKFTIDGLESDLEVPEILTTIRTDISLVIVHGDIPLWQARLNLTALPNVEVRAHIPPSGFLLQGDASSLAAASKLDVVAAVHPLPLAFMIDGQLMDILADASTISSPTALSTAVQLNGWKETEMGTPLDEVRFGNFSNHLGEVAENYLMQHRQIDSGRHLGILNLAEVPTVVSNPALSWLTLEPVFAPHNNLAVGHIRADDVEHYFPLIDLNGSGHSVTVADSGIDRDHGDFNGRIQHVESVIWGDSSTEDVHSGHGTHVACTVLGNGSRGGYAGVAPQATLRFQAMEDDDDGEFGGVSMDSLVRKAYEGNSHIHTNSWGAGSYFGEYTTSSEDADSRTNTYDQFWSYDGMIVLVSAGNDGPDSDTITPPATAKNVVAVG